MKRKILTLLSASLILASLVLTVSADNEWHGGDIFRGRGEKLVALTFDDGPHPKQTPEILAILEEYDIKATFFMIGQNIVYYPETAEAVEKAGHEIGNHTFTHDILEKRSKCDIISEIELADDMILTLSEYEPKFLRPPGGNYDENVISAAEDEDLVIALWSIDTLDWCHKSKGEIVREVTENVRGGDVILMHDYIAGESHTADALRVIIPELLSEGYKFVTLSEMYLSK